MRHAAEHLLTAPHDGSAPPHARPAPADEFGWSGFGWDGFDWDGFGALVADFGFELDGAGHIRSLAPARVLGYPAAELIGKPAAGLLWAEAAGAPEMPTHTVPLNRARQTRTSWVRDAEGGERCVSIVLATAADPCGPGRMVRGLGTDVTARERRELQMAAALRRADMLEHLLDQMRQEALAPGMLATMLDALMHAIGGTGAAVLDLAEPPELLPVMQEAGTGCTALVADLLDAIRSGADAPRQFAVGDQRVLTCPATTRFGHEVALAVWRDDAGPGWREDDPLIVASVAGLARMVFEHEAIQRELARQARTDPLTGLLNRRAFVEEAKRRIDRLERDGLPGTLMFIDLDRFKPLNDLLGHDAGDNALMQTSEILRRVVRPADLVARLGGDEFALWMDGFDELSAAERAEQLRLSYPAAMQGLAPDQDLQLSLSIGIACRQPGSGEELEDVLQRADRVMYQVKRRGGASWRVSHPEQLV